MANPEELYNLIQQGTITLDEALEIQKRDGMQHTAPPADAGKVLADFGEQVARKTAAVGTGAGRAFAATAGLPMDLLVGLNNATAGGPFANPQQFPDVKNPKFGGQDLVRRVNSVLYQPEGRTEERLAAISQGAYGMLQPGISGKGIVLGGVSGGAGQAARELLPDSPNAPAISELATMLLGMVAMKTPRDVKTIKGAVDEIGTNELERMKVAQQEAEATLGTPVVATHFAPENTSLQALVREIANSPEGAPMREALRGEAHGMAKEQAAFPGSVTPQTDFTRDHANRVARALQTAQQAPHKALRDSVKPLYDAAKNQFVPKPIVDKLVSVLRGIPGELGLDRLGPAATKVESFVKRVEGAGEKIPARAEIPPSSVLGPDGAPLNPGSPAIPEINLPPSVAELDSVGKGARTAAKTAGSKYNVDSTAAEAKVAMERTHAAIREMTIKVSPELKQAKEMYTEGMERLTPWREGPLGDVFPKSAAKKGTAHFTDSMKWLRADTTSPTDVKFVGEQVRKSNPDEFRMMVGQNVLDAAQNSPDPATFVKMLIGEADTAANKQAVFKESINQAALAAGKNVDEAAEASEGALRLLETLRKVAKGHENARGTIQTGAAKTAGENMFSGGLRFLNPIGMYVRAWAEAGPIENAFRRKVFKSLSNTLSTPEGIDRLIEISKFSLMEHSGRILARGLVGLNAQQEE